MDERMILISKLSVLSKESQIKFKDKLGQSEVTPLPSVVKDIPQDRIFDCMRLIDALKEEEYHKALKKDAVMLEHFSEMEEVTKKAEEIKLSVSHSGQTDTEYVFKNDNDQKEYEVIVNRINRRRGEIHMNYFPENYKGYGY